MLAVMQGAWWYDGNGGWISGGMSINAGDVLDLIWNADTGTLKIYKNNTLAFSHTNAAMVGTMCLFASNHSVPSGVLETWAFNDADWTYAAQDGAVSLCTDNLPARSPKVPSTPQTGTVTCNGTIDNTFILLGMTLDQSGTSTVNGVTLVWGTNALACAIGVKLISAAFNGSLNYSIAVAAYSGGSNIPPATAQ